MTKLVSIGWRPSSYFGWGVFGLNLALELEAGDGPKPLVLPLQNPSEVLIDGIRTHFLARTLARSIEFQRANGEAAPLGIPHLVPLSNGLPQVAPTPDSYGFVFLEDSAVPADGIQRAATFRKVLAGSQWNTDVLKAHGLDRVATVIQGVDTNIFCPGPKRGLFRDRFVVFSGGKLEFRKGQDIVVKAFATFRQRHPDALLAFCWGNLFPQYIATIGWSPHGTGVPPTDANGGSDLNGWLQANGLPDDSFVNLGFVPNTLMPGVLRDCDMAVFPNRSEGGTNLVAMEAMACGLPVALSANTGHMDVIHDHACYALRRQGRCVAPAGIGTEGWGETDVEELLEAMESAYRDRDEARRRGAIAALTMQGLSWKNQTRAILAELG